jgi:hypothetical protein
VEPLLPDATPSPDQVAPPSLPAPAPEPISVQASVEIPKEMEPPKSAEPENPGYTDIHLRGAELAKAAMPDVSLSLDDIQLDVTPASSFEDVPRPAEAPISPPESPKAEPLKAKTNDKHEETGVLRWTLRALTNEYNMRRLHAVCVLTEGDTPLRILNPSGAILVSDESGIKVDPTKFKVVAELFGLG